ncbi:MAG: thymidine phosphorylase [Nanoarchaeota archaeon]|nr:thymidine phosphorylase [Nanoarchaeota archaeon]MBU4086498.1 thymidine phosphorylase [Nanoarchaeota archaeon]
MQLKVKFLKLSAGRPVAVLHKKLAVKSSMHVDERVLIRKNSHKIVAVVDIAVGMLKEDEIAVSTEISQQLSLKEGEMVYVEPATSPQSIPLISKKLKCKTLNYQEIKKIMQDIVENALTESEIAYFISAVYRCGMSMKEIEEMVRAIVDTGKKLNLKQKLIADKHSIGGIPGRTTPIVVSICAAAGLTFPKTSSRAITSPSGTADALEVICKVDFTIPEIKKIINKTNACMVWGGSLGLAPADDKIIQVERLMNLDPDAQLLASIMSKKLAVGSKYILIEIPYGKHAKVNKKQALNLEKKFKLLAKRFNVKLECALIETKEPLSNGIGPALEIKEVISVLKRESSGFMLEERALVLAGKILELTGKAKSKKGLQMAKKILDSGEALNKFKQIILAQKGKLNGLREAKIKKQILSQKSGEVKEINIKSINTLARLLGCPADKFAGIYLHKHLKEKVKKGEKILTLYSESSSELDGAIKFYNQSNPITIK